MLRKLLLIPALPWKIFVRKSLFHPGFWRNPYPMYRWLREREPVRMDPVGPLWILTRYEDVAAMWKEPAYLKDTVGGIIEQKSMLFLDPPDHTRVRSVFTRAFTPATLSRLRGRIEQVCRDRLDRVHQSGRMELMADLAAPLPVIVIAEMLGFPLQDADQLKHWSDVMTASLAITARRSAHKRAEIARQEIRRYFDGIVASMKKTPGDSMLSRLLETQGRPGGLNGDEIFTNSVLLLAAGHETTTNLIGNCAAAMMSNRDQWDLLVADPSLIDSAVEETLRYNSPVQWGSRMTAQPTTIGGREIAGKTIILGCVGAGNRDPARFPDPDRFDIRRADLKHLSFGGGAHFCLGAALARMEARIAISMLAERYPKMRWTGKKLRWIKGLTFRGVRELPLQLR